MGEIVSSIKRVSDIVGEISAATVEQSGGIQQVGDAIGQMDQVTQQNAALVEEGAAAAESLKSQAQQLLAAVAFFKLAAHSYAGTRPANERRSQSAVQPAALHVARLALPMPEPAKLGMQPAEWTAF
jgi:hypothetical protein